jgi:hypothetical protein
MLKEGELETVLSPLMPEGNKSRVSGYGLELGSQYPNSSLVKIKAQSGA